MSNNTYKHYGSSAPYYDDWKSSKNFKKILFRPSRAVQARELTQSQTLLQDQIASIGSYMFKDGTPITGARITFSSSQPCLTATNADMDNQPIAAELLKGLTYYGNISGQKIYVIDAEDNSSGSSTDDTKTVYFSYIGGSIDSDTQFISTTTPTRTFKPKANSVGNAITATCTEGTMFINGYYVNIPASTIIVTNKNLNSTYSIGFEITNTVVTAESDSSLNDNAYGSTNFSAPGADRYKIEASLCSFKGTTAPSGMNFIAGIVIRNGTEVIKEQSNPSDGTELLDLLAERTYDESGSYTVNPWKGIIKAHDTDASKYVISLQAGSGYINGYNVKTIVPTDIEVDKPRTYITKKAQYVFANSGLYTYGLYSNGVLSAVEYPDFLSAEECYVMPEAGKTTGVAYGTTASSINTYVENKKLGGTNGSCRITSINKEGNKLFIYLADASSVLNVFPSAKSICSKSDPSKFINLYVNENGYAELYGQESPDIVGTNLSRVKSISNESIDYQCVKYYKNVQAVTSGSNVALTVTDSDTKVRFVSNSIVGVCIHGTGTQVNVNEMLLTPNNASIATAVIVDTGGYLVAGTSYDVCINVTINDKSSRVKTLTTVTETFTVQYGTDSVTLGNEDIFDLVSVVVAGNGSNSTNIKDSFTLDNGQRDHYYDKGIISGFDALNTSASGSIMYDVTYRYFSHERNSYGPFTVSSYMTASNQNAVGSDYDLYSNIPSYTGSMGTVYTLADCLDFRVKKSELDSQLVMTYPFGRNEIEFSGDIYLPRRDRIYVDKTGVFGIQMGIPSESPVLPLQKDDAITLYTVGNRAYVKTLSDVTLQYIDNKRYTMRDIANLETRISNVENAVSLSQLELSTVNLNITDEDGYTRYKTGIFTDNLGSFSSANYASSEWNANIDAIEQSLRCNYNCEHLDFEFNEDESDTAITQSGKTVYLTPSSTKVYAQNLFASEATNVQKLMFYIWKGVAELTPSVDTWVNDLGNIIVSVSYNTSAKAPTVFRTWSTTTSNTTLSTSSTSKSLGTHTTVNKNNYNYDDVWETVSTTNYLTATTNYTTTNYAAQRLYTSTWVINDNATQMESQDEYCRERYVEYECKGMRQGMTISATIDDVALTLEASDDNDSNYQVVSTAGILKGKFKIPANLPVGTKTVKFFDSVGTCSASAQYKASGKTIWNNVDRTYIREWIDTGTYGDAYVTGSNSWSTTSTATTGTTTEDVLIDTVYVDPIAQSFYVNETTGIYLDSIDLYFNSKPTDSSEANVPVWIRIVEMENGYPTTRILPFSTVYKFPDDVNVPSTKWTSDTTTTMELPTATNFKFDCPIYLKGNTEYAFVVLTTSYKYEIFTSTLGKANIVDGYGIYEQPYIGSMFLSQNASTWTAEQQSDVTFKINSCVFDTSTSGVAVFDVAQSELSSDFEVAQMTLVSNEFAPSSCEIAYQYKWSGDGNYKTAYINSEDVFLTGLQYVKPANETASVKVYATFKTNSENITPMIDTEQIYGVFTNNIVSELSASLYDAGTYVSKPISLLYDSTNIRVMLDAILPNKSYVEVYYKTCDNYQPMYVLQAGSGDFGIDRDAAEALDGQSVGVYYHNASSNKLVYKSNCVISGYELDNSECKVYMHAVGDVSVFYDSMEDESVVASRNANSYPLISNSYTAIVLLPYTAAADIPIAVWNTTSTYSYGEYVYYGGYVWQAVRTVSANQIPSEYSISWKKIHSIKTKSVVKYDSNVSWMPMMQSTETTSSVDTQNSFIEYSYEPKLSIANSFTVFSIMVKMFSRDKLNVPRVKNIRAIATV